MHPFQILKDLGNACLKLYHIDFQSDIISWTDASDYNMAYLYQMVTKFPNAIEQSVRFLSKTVNRVDGQSSKKMHIQMYFCSTKVRGSTRRGTNDSHYEQIITIKNSWTKTVLEKCWIGNFPSNIFFYFFYWTYLRVDDVSTVFSPFVHELDR